MSNNDNKLIGYLFNPFRYLSGVQCLVAGLVLLAVCAVHGGLAGVRYDGLLRINMAQTSMLAEAIKLLLISGLMIALLWLAARALGAKDFRLQTLAGTQLLARWPYLLMSLLLVHIPGYLALMQKLMNMKPIDAATTLQGGDVMLLTLSGIWVLLMTIWCIALMYSSFSMSCKVQGGKAIAAFAVALLLDLLLAGPLLMAGLLRVL